MKSAIRTVYYCFVLSVPLETILYFKQEEDGRSGVSASRVLGLLLFGLALVDRRLCFRKTPTAFWLVAWYLAAFSLSQLWIPGQFDARFQEEQLTLFQLAALFLVSANLFSDAAFRERLLRVFGWGMVVVAVALLLGAFGMDMGPENRDTVQNQNPNTIAALFALAAVCLAADPRVIGSKRWLPYALAVLAAAAALTGGILRTGSRGALVSLAAGIAGLVVCGGKANRVARAVVAVVVAGLLGLLVLREIRNGTSMAVRLERALSRGDTAGRTGIYDAAWSMFLERPMFGYGGANNRMVLGTFLDYASKDTRSAERDTHNDVLGVLTEVGLVGGLPFVAALLLALWSAWRHGQRSGEAQPFSLMCGTLVFSMLGSASHEKIFWIVLAAAVGAGEGP